MIFTSKSGFKFEHQEDFKGEVVICDPSGKHMRMDIDSLLGFFKHVTDTVREQIENERLQPVEMTVGEALSGVHDKLCGYSWFIGCFWDGEKIVVKCKKKPGSFEVREDMNCFYSFPVEFVCV